MAAFTPNRLPPAKQIDRTTRQIKIRQPRTEPQPSSEDNKEGSTKMAQISNSLTVIGNLTADPELKKTQQGISVVNISIAHTPREFNREANEWKDGETLFIRASFWRDEAEHISASYSKGSRVIAIGELKSNNYEDKEGIKRSGFELGNAELAASSRYATLSITKVSKQEIPGNIAPATSAPVSPTVSKATEAVTEDVF